MHIMHMTGLEGPRIVSLDVMPIETRNYYVGAELTSVMWGNSKALLIG